MSLNAGQAIHWRSKTAGRRRPRATAQREAEFAGHSANATAKGLNDRKFPTARGGNWTARSVINVFALASLMAPGDLDYESFDYRPVLDKQKAPELRLFDLSASLSLPSSF